MRVRRGAVVGGLLAGAMLFIVPWRIPVRLIGLIDSRIDSEVQLQGGTVEASFDGGNPAIVSHTFGVGRTLVFAFDLLGTRMALSEDSSSASRPSTPI